MGHKLLLADDSITIQKVVGIIFGNDEYELTIVDNGTAALDKASEMMPDIMLVDAIMPGKTGYEVSQAIRSNPALSHTPILLLTGAFEPFDENSARSSGIDDYIAKPFESQHLIEKVKTLLSLGKERAASAPAPSAAPIVPEAKPAPAADPWQDFALEPAVEPAAASPGSSDFSFAEEAEPEAYTVEMAAEPVTASPADDLWGAFELEEVPEESDADFGVVEVGEAPAAASEEDPFAFGMEVDLTQADEAAPPADTTPAVEGAWHEEEAFSFAMEDESAATEEPPGTGTGTAAADTAWGGEEVFSFAEEPETPAATTEEEFAAEAFSAEPEEAPVPAFTTPVQEPAPPVAPSGTMTLSEEQLAGLVSKISRDIIERIAWEVVPDLAEALIKEEIRKIKEGR